MSVLLLFPDRVEIRRVDYISSVSPRIPEAAYQFLIPPGRRAWVAREVSHYPSPDPDASWRLRVRDLSPQRQRIQLELFGDGISGLVYEASDREIVPLYTRLTGPGFVFTVGAINLGLWSIFWIVVYIVLRVWRRNAADDERPA